MLQGRLVEVHENHVAPLKRRSQEPAHPDPEEPDLTRTAAVSKKVRQNLLLRPHENLPQKVPRRHAGQPQKGALLILLGVPRKSRQKLRF